MATLERAVKLNIVSADPPRLRYRDRRRKRDSAEEFLDFQI